jgi:hypothetical protein
MTRLKSIPLAIGALVILAGTVAAFATMPDAAGPGLEKATEVSGKAVPVRAVPADAPANEAPAADPASETAADLPDAASHGDDVSAVATAEDTTPDTNHGADVSIVAKDNAGQDAVTEHKPATAGKPADAGKPDGAGQPEDPGKPDDPGRP